MDPTTLTHSFDFPNMLNKRTISPNVVIRYPILGSRRAYIKREVRTRMVFPHFIPFHIWIIFCCCFLLKMLTTIRIIDDVPKVTADQKGRNPGPGSRPLPIPICIDSKHSRIEITSHTTPINCSRLSIIITKRSVRKDISFVLHKVPIPLVLEHQLLHFF
jgi:hypothetical protein